MSASHYNWWPTCPKHLNRLLPCTSYTRRMERWMENGERAHKRFYIWVIHRHSSHLYWLLATNSAGPMQFVFPFKMLRLAPYILRSHLIRSHPSTHAHAPSATTFYGSDKSSGIPVKVGNQFISFKWKSETFSIVFVQSKLQFEIYYFFILSPCTNGWNANKVIGISGHCWHRSINTSGRRRGGAGVKWIAHI